MGFLGKSSRKKKASASDKFIDLAKEASEKTPLVRTAEVKVVNENDDPFQNEIKAFVKDIEDDQVPDEEVIQHLEARIEMSSPSPLQTKRLLRTSYTGYDNFTLLHYAVKNFRPKLSQFLIDTIEIDVNIRTSSKLTPLHVLVKSQSFPKYEVHKKTSAIFARNARSNAEKKTKFIETFQLLIEKGADINSQDESDFSVLHHAVFRNNYEAVYRLLELPSIIIEMEDENNMTPLHVACKYGLDDITELLVDRISPRLLVNSAYESLPIHLICKSKNENKLLLGKMLEKIKQESEHDLYEVLQKIDHNRQTLLQSAIEHNHMQMVRFLITEYYTKPALIEDKTGNLPIHTAAKSSGPEMLDVLIECNAFSLKRNANLDNALHIAAANNCFRFITAFLEYEKTYVENLTEKELREYIPSVKCYNRSGYTPLFVALIAGNIKCVEAILTAEHLDLEAKDAKGNSIYHICAEYNSLESMRVLLSKKEQQFVEPLFIKNNKEETPIHTATLFGNLDIIKMVIDKLNNGISSIETYLISKNKEGKTCFHIACQKGFFNIIEYFLRDLKIYYFMDQIDRDFNTPLILAAVNGHLSIVEILLEHGADLNAKNRQGSTALELSCRKGFFEISKVLISRYSIMQAGGHHEAGVGIAEYPLHIACFEGAYEVVELLLSKGAEIDVLNSDNQNCLDIAMEQGHREVVKVLLNDKNWHKLILPVSHERIDHKLNLMNVGFRRQINRYTRQSRRENPQLCHMFELKMWDAIKMVLDRCHNDIDGSFNFSKLDPPCQNIHRHPLMLMARSGQETILKHETTQRLLDLKWRFIPRFAFYFNLIIYLLFICLFAIYSYNLSNYYMSGLDELKEIRRESLNKINATNVQQNHSSGGGESWISTHGSGLVNLKDPPGSSHKNLSLEEQEEMEELEIVEEFNSDPLTHILTQSLYIIITMSMLKKLFQILFVDRLSFFSSPLNLAEIVSYSIAFIAIYSDDLDEKLNLASCAVLLSFIVFSFLIQKLRVFGLYVLAFRRTLSNSSKFFPIFFLVFIGFNLSFRLRTHFGVTYFNSTAGNTLIRTLSMALGELDNDAMGLDSGSVLNFVFYFLFIGLMCVITFNLFVGIAVGEIKTVLDEADIQQISMRIIFVLKVQDTLQRFQKIPCLRCLNITYQKYDYKDEFKFIKTKDKFFAFFRRRFASIEPSIKLVDPIKRLEDNLNELAKRTNSDLKAIRELLASQINDVETKLSNSQQRLEDVLVEMSRKTTNNFESTKEDNENQLQEVQSAVVNSKDAINDTLKQLEDLTETKMEELRKNYDEQMRKAKEDLLVSQQLIQSNITMLSSATEQMSKMTNEQFANIGNTFLGLFDKMNSLKNDMERLGDKLDGVKSVQESLASSSEKLANYFVDAEIKQVLTEIIDQMLYENQPTTTTTTATTAATSSSGASNEPPPPPQPPQPPSSS